MKIKNKSVLKAIGLKKIGVKNEVRDAEVSIKKELAPKIFKIERNKTKNTKK